ncbi:hypothetical protein CDAR_498191 [Caerostris darwini]|uniref:Uncharacterized protein n=1 Tax=Caerostris darwini TaxID=1538125 RepID=A0AAV4U000_9ARAC|nr:hypothetical protein CDAR_498191 [Caerostris darwini]
MFQQDGSPPLWKEHLSPSLLRRVIPSQKEPQLLSLGRRELKKKFLQCGNARAVPPSGYSAKKRGIWDEAWKEHPFLSLRRVIPSQKEPQLLSLGRRELKKKFLQCGNARAVPSSGYSAKKRGIRDEVGYYLFKLEW